MNSRTLINARIPRPDQPSRLAGSGAGTLLQEPLMAKITAQQAGGTNVVAFLDMLAWSEGTSTSPATKNQGYDVIVTGADRAPEIFTDYSVHPFSRGRKSKAINSKGLTSNASWAKPLRIMGVTTAPFGAAEGAYMQVPAGRRYAVISSRSCQRIERGVGFRLTGPQGDGTGAAGSGRFYYAGATALIPQSDNATQFSASGHFVLIDVTGH